MYRQDDVQFVGVLNAIRRGEQRPEHRALFSDCYTGRDVEVPGKPIKLRPKNDQAQEINEREMEAIPGPPTVTDSCVSRPSPEHLPR